MIIHSNKPRYILISSFILEQLRSDKKFRNLHYVARFEFLSNQKDKKYVEKIMKRTNKSFKELKKDSQIFIMNIRSLVVKELEKLEYLNCINLLNDKKELDKFLTLINTIVEEENKNDFFLQ